MQVCPKYQIKNIFWAIASVEDEPVTSRTATGTVYRVFIIAVLTVKLELQR